MTAALYVILRSFMRGAVFALVAALLASFAPAGGATLAAGTTYVAGVRASAGGAAGVRGAMIVRARRPREADVELYEVRSGRIVRAYDIAMTQRAHLILIGADFRTFAHLHPALSSGGRFRIRLRVPHAGRYYLYADTEPHALGRQVFRFDVDFGRAPPHRRDLQPQGARVRSGQYTVSLDSLRLNTGRPTVLTAAISKGGRPAPDLHAYLGGAAHAVFINVRTLAYLHVHPMVSRADMPASAQMDMPHMRSEPAGNRLPAAPELPPNASVAPSLHLYVPAAAHGTYRLWVQFRGTGGIFVAPFILRAGYPDVGKGLAPRSVRTGFCRVTRQ